MKALLKRRAFIVNLSPVPKGKFAHLPILKENAFDVIPNQMTTAYILPTLINGNIVDDLLFSWFIVIQFSMHFYDFFISVIPLRS
jgi:hypothetical protein